MRAGLLNCQVAVQRKSVTRSATGAEVETWPQVAMVWASISPIGGREVLEGARVIADVTHQIGMRYMGGITPTHRIVYNDGTRSRVFNLVQVYDMNEQRRELRILAKEVVA